MSTRPRPSRLTIFSSRALRSFNGAALTSAPFDEKEIEGDIGRLATAEQQVIEDGAASLIESHDLAVEDAALRKALQQPIEALEAVPVLGEHPDLDSIGDATEAIVLELEKPARSVEWLFPHNGNDRVHAPTSKRMSEPRVNEKKPRP